MLNWDRAEPVLRAIYASMDRSTVGMTGGVRVCEELGLSPDETMSVFQVLRGSVLRGSGYIQGYFGANGLPQQIQPTEKGLQYCMGWPVAGDQSAFVAKLTDVIQARTDDESLPEIERSKLRDLGRAVANVGKDVLTDIVAKVVEHQAGV